MNDKHDRTRVAGEPPGAETVSAAAHDSRRQFDRRRFLEAAGFSLSLTAVTACTRRPVQHAMPLGEMPDSFAPGKLVSYAATCNGCPAGCGLLVGVRDGRPLKMEGMPEHPLSRGGLCAVGQALPIALYDRHRLDGPLRRGKPAQWESIDRAVLQELQAILESGGAVRLVTGTRTSPTLAATIAAFLGQFKDGKHVVVDPVSCSSIRAAHHSTHGASRLPRYRFDRAAVIVSFGADFLGTWISPVEYAAAWRQQRIPTVEQPQMSYHAHFEPQLTVTGSKADRRYRVAPQDYTTILAHLAKRLGALPLPENTPSLDSVGSFTAHDLETLARRLQRAKGASLVVCDSQDLVAQQLVNAINEQLGNYGKTLELDRPSFQRQGDDAALADLLDELEEGVVAALLVADVDLLHDLPESSRIRKGLKKAQLVVSFADHLNETARVAHCVCPESHLLESWNDFHPVGGLVSLSQPTIRPLGKTRTLLECLARWSGSASDDRTLIRQYWEKAIRPRATDPGADPVAFWDNAVQLGFVEIEESPQPAGYSAPGQLELASVSRPDEGYTVLLYAKTGMPESRHAHNPWLQELPDPVTKVSWDNYVCMGPSTAEELGVGEGDIVELSVDDVNLELPVYVLPGQHDRVLGVALAYGCPGTERFAQVGPSWLEARPTVPNGRPVGRNAAPLLNWQGKSLQRVRYGVSVRKTGRRRPLAVTQLYHSLKLPESIAAYGAPDRSDIVQSTTLEAFRADPESGKPEVHVDANLDLWPPDHPKSGHAWGLLVDLNACTGCSACVIACQSENNIPVVGWDEVRRQREMYWMRIDRYVQGEDDDLDVRVQPVMCQHCDHAPCETVCPVLATVHSEEGLNQQAYNRCVGTRYCANNCPFKVRRFNWFNYRHDSDRENLALNPDVVVRTRGVMEKCSMCVQRIEAARVEAKKEGRAISEGDVQVACQQSCPAQAIVFGDLNDPKSRISQLAKDPRQYRMLEEYGFQTNVGYRRIVRNREGGAESTGHPS